MKKTILVLEVANNWYAKSLITLIFFLEYKITNIPGCNANSFQNSW